MKLLKQCECCKGEGHIEAMTPDRVMTCPLCDGGGQVSTLHPLTWVAFVIGLLFLSVIVAGIVCYKYTIT